MLNDLPKIQPPDWLMEIDPKKTEPLIPLIDLLTDSLYYPASGTNGKPIKNLLGNVFSFVYADYDVSQEKLDNDIHDIGFNGYKILVSRKVSLGELSPHSWQVDNLSDTNGDPMKYYDLEMIRSSAYAKWIVFERCTDLDDTYGPKRFSLLFLCVEGVAAFQALYLANNITPKYLAIIQPGTGFGLNWTDFTKSSAILSRAVLSNPAGKPNFLLYGGNGKRTEYPESCWPEYDYFKCYFDNTGHGTIGLWSKQL